MALDLRRALDSLTADVLIIELAAVLTVLCYQPHLADPFVYQDANLAFQVSPVVVHTLSLALHLLNGLLLWALLTRLKVAGAPWIVALFWLHPLASEAVAYGAAQQELFICAGLLTLALCVASRWWFACVLPIAVLSMTKAGAALSVAMNAGVAAGISYTTWTRWEATAVGRSVLLWIWPVGLSLDHDVVHSPLLSGAMVAACGWVLLSWIISARHLPWRINAACMWLLVILGSRFIVRTPLNPFAERHLYSALPAASMLTVTGLRKVLA